MTHSKPRVELIDGKYKEKIHAYPIRVRPDKWVHLDRSDAPEFIYKNIPGHKLKGQALNLDWCYAVYGDMLQYSHADPTLTCIFEQHGHLFIETTDAYEYRTMKLREWLTMIYEQDHAFFKRKTRNLTN